MRAERPRRNVEIKAYFTPEEAHRLGELAAEMRTSISSLVHDLVVRNMQNMKDDVIAIGIARRESMFRDAYDIASDSMRTIDIIQWVNDTIERVNLCVINDVPPHIIKDEIILPVIEGLKKLDNKLAKWGIEKLESLKYDIDRS